MEILIGRIYDATPTGVLRVLVDRLWPRGVRKDGRPWDVWLKDAAPSSELRRWYHAHADAQEEFRLRYRAELELPDAEAGLERLACLGAEGPLALLTAKREVAESYLPTLRAALMERLGQH